MGVSEGGRVGVVERYYKLQRYKKVPMDEQIKIQMVKWQNPLLQLPPFFFYEIV